MSFDPMPMDREERKRQQMAHAQQMLNIINALGSYSENPLPRFNYGQKALDLNQDVSKDFAASLLLSSGGNFGGGRSAALQRRIKRNE